MYVFNTAGFAVSLEIGCFLFMIALTKDIQRTLHSINENTKSKKKRTKISKQLIEFIKFHSILKQLSEFQRWFTNLLVN